MRQPDDYSDLIIPWYANQPRFVQMVEDTSSILVGLRDFIAHLPEDFDLDEAVGVQLDVVGQWVGRSRFIRIPLSNMWFSFDDAPRGFDLGYWMGPYDQSYGIARLDDDVYRNLLYGKIISNNWDGSVDQALTAMRLMIPDLTTNLIIDNRGDDSIDFGISGRVPDNLKISLWHQDYLPFKPAGKKSYYLVTSIDTYPLFGFDVQNAYISGWDTGTWGVTPQQIAQGYVVPDDPVPVVVQAPKPTRLDQPAMSQYVPAML